LIKTSILGAVLRPTEGQSAQATHHRRPTPLSVERLEAFVDRAHSPGIDPEAVIAVLDGETTMLPWSDEART
jgi:hypothetical protein